MKNLNNIIRQIKHQISCFKSEKSKVGATKIDKLSLGGRIAALEELLAFLGASITYLLDYIEELFEEDSTRKIVLYAYKDSELSGREYERVVQYVNSILADEKK